MKNIGLTKIVLLVLSALFVSMDVSAENIAKVVDENGQPVAGAKVIILYTSQAQAIQTENAQKAGNLQTEPAESAYEKLTVTADPNGNFIVPSGIGTYKIVSVKKEGYEFSASDQAPMSTKSGETMQIALTQKSAPAYLNCSETMLRFQKDSVGSYVLNADSGLVHKKRDSDILNNSGQLIEQKEANSLPEIKGITICSSTNPAGDMWLLTLISDSQDGGILASDKLLYVAPDQGYKSQVVIEFPIDTQAQEFKKYVYIKALDTSKKQTEPKSSGLVFSRLELSVIEGKAKLIANVRSYSNSDGSRNLHYQQQFQEAKQKELQARLDKGIEEKSLSPEEIQSLQTTLSQSASSEGMRWDFEGNRRREMEGKRRLLLEAEGRTRPSKKITKTAG